MSQLEKSFSTTKDCSCLKLSTDNGIIERVLSKEDEYSLTCYNGKLPPQEIPEPNDPCGYGEHHAVDLSTRKACACPAKTLLHELLHTDPERLIHTADNQSKQDSSFAIFNAVEKCITCEGRVVQ